MPEPDNFRDLAHGLSNDWLCEHLDVTARTLRDWRKGRRKPPKAVRELLKLINCFDLSAIGGKDWDGFIFGRGHLSIPWHDRPFTASQLSAMYLYISDLPILRGDLRQAQKQIADLRAQLDRHRPVHIKIEADGKTVYDSAQIA
jgi:hypothetical protein